MRALVQRVVKAGVEVDGKRIADIGPGLLVLLGVARGDNDKDLEWLAGKIARLRVFADEKGKMNLSVLDKGGEVLVVSQFTLYGDVRRGNRPGFEMAADPDLALDLYERFCRRLEDYRLKVSRGQFAAAMMVDLVNDGPVTLMLESPGKRAENV